jgi:hypothetical protein
MRIQHHKVKSVTLTPYLQDKEAPFYTLDIAFKSEDGEVDFICFSSTGDPVEIKVLPMEDHT